MTESLPPPSRTLPAGKGLTHDTVDRLTPELVREIRGLCENELYGILLYGSAVGGGFKGERSNVNVLVVLKSLDVGVLQKLSPVVAKWDHDLFIVHATTLANLRASAEVLPGHLLELRDHHRVLWGSDPTEDVSIGKRALLWASERDLHEIIRHMTRAVLLHGEARQQLGGAVRRHFRTFLYTLRTMLRYVDQLPKTTDKHPTIKSASAAFGLDEAVLLDLLDFRRRMKVVTPQQVDVLAGGLLEQLTKAAAKVRDLAIEAPSA